jgi:hypothetical protein
MASLDEPSQITMRYFSDKKPELTSPLAAVNYAGHYPAGSSFRSINHYMQMFKTGEIKMYDHGAAKNKKKYG